MAKIKSLQLDLGFSDEYLKGIVRNAFRGAVLGELSERDLHKLIQILVIARRSR